jgi:AGZA family xanthine/uracil permease-like MFS transporter
MLSDFFDTMGTVIGVGAGFVAYCFIKVVRGKAAQVQPIMYLATAAFVVYFALPAFSG